jgi:NAD+ synthase
MKIIGVQDNPTVGDIDGNLKMILDYREKYNHVDLIVFSECFLSGYPLGDLVLNPLFLERVRKALDKIIHVVSTEPGPALLVPAPLQGPGKPYNSVMLIDEDSVQVSYKHHLPNELVYDEIRTFSSGPLPKPLSFRGVKMGFPICEDIWHGDVVRHLVEEGAEIIISPNGSHFTVGKQSIREKLVIEQSLRYNVPFLYVNQIGGQDDLVFDGGSFLVSQGETLNQEAIMFKKNTITFDTDNKKKSLGIKQKSHVSHYNSDVYYSCVLGLRDFIAKNGFSKVVIGNSGGLDSAMTATIAVDALGADNVLLVSMPSAYTSEESQNDGSDLAFRLGCKEIELPIRNLMHTYNEYDNYLEELGIKKDQVASENIQARFRMQILMDISRKTKSMVLATGNRSELSVGYSTIGGDLMGGFNVLKGIFKSTIPDIAEWRNNIDINEHKDFLYGKREGYILCDNLIYKKPSAELSEGQTDESALGPYPILDATLRCLIDKKMSIKSTSNFLKTNEFYEKTKGSRKKLDTSEYREEYVEKISKLIKISQFKRRQAPPGVVIEDKDFSLDFRLPIAGFW